LKTKAKDSWRASPSVKVRVTKESKLLKTGHVI
jgi:hypothetical protein